MKKNKGRIFIRVIILLIALLMIFHFKIVTLTYVSGTSMHPTIKNGSIKIFTKFNNRKNVGDVVIINKPKSWITSDGLLFKRMVADSGDRVKIQGQDIKVNDKILISDFESGLELEFEVPEGYILVMGDNYQRSYDSFFHIKRTGNIEESLISKKDVRYSRGDIVSKVEEIDNFVKNYNK